MKKNKIAILLVFFLGTAAVWFVITNQSSTINEAFRSFAVADTAAIYKIILSDKLNTVILERQTKGAWKLNTKNRADNFALKRLLYTINKIDVKTPVGKKDADAVIKKLVGHAVKCNIYTNGELEKSYYVGDATPDNLGTYMVLIDNETQQPSGKPFITYVPGYNSSLTTHYSADTRSWRDKTVFNYNEPEIRSIKVEHPQKPENSYELLINGNQYQLRTLSNNNLIKDIDTTTVKQYLTYFFNLNFEAVDTTVTVAKEEPFSIVTVTDIKGIANKVIFYSLKNNTEERKKGKESFQSGQVQLYALLDNGDVVKVQVYLFGKIMPEVNYFLKSK